MRLRSLCNLGRLVVATSGWLLLWPHAAGASVVLPLSEAQLVAYADTIVVGSVTGLEVVVNARHEVRTYAALQVHRRIRGVPEGSSLRLDIPGGTYRGIVHEVAGAPRLHPGQLAVFFLQARPEGYRPVGLNYGVFDVERTAAQGHWLRRSLTGLSYAGNGVAPVLGGDLMGFLQRLDAHVLRLGETR